VAATTRGRYYVETLGRGLALLDCLLEEPGQLTLAELGRRAGLGPATTLRLLRTLEEAGYVRQDPETRRFRLSWKLLRGGLAPIMEVAEAGRPHLEALAARLDEATGMAVLDGTQVRCVLRVSSSRLVSANVSPGTVFPAHATAMGKVLLAHAGPRVARELVRREPLRRFTPRTIVDPDQLLTHLARVAEQGYAISDGEWEVGLRSLAAPVRAGRGRVVAAACVLLVRPDMEAAHLEGEFLPNLLQAAAAVSRDLG
jgi:IclR family transcriptional regulator, pca regulon regulatory protein